MALRERQEEMLRGSSQQWSQTVHCLRKKNKHVERLATETQVENLRESQFYSSYENKEQLILGGGRERTGEALLPGLALLGR